MSASVVSVVDDYCLVHDLVEDTERYYRRTVSVYQGWAATNGADFCARSVSEFLRAKQLEGCSPYYIRSLRSGLRALLTFAGHNERIRTIKLPELNHRAWVDAQVAMLVAAVDRAIMPTLTTPEAERRRRFWRTIIPAAWYTGLNQIDLSRLTPEHLDERGRVIIRRHRTNKRSVTWLPPEVLREFEANPQPWKLQTSTEYFRREFAQIVKAAGLVGTFKTLRKSSGNDVENKHPGRGHEHLANSRAVFERHYRIDDLIDVEPMRPTMLPRT